MEFQRRAIRWYWVAVIAICASAVDCWFTGIFRDSDGLAIVLIAVGLSLLTTGAPIAWAMSSVAEKLVLDSTRIRYYDWIGRLRIDTDSSEITEIDESAIQLATGKSISLQGFTSRWAEVASAVSDLRSGVAGNAFKSPD